MHGVKKFLNYFSSSTPRTIALLVGILAVSVFSTYLLSSPSSQQISEGPTVSADEKAFFLLLNQKRAEQGLAPLKLDQSLVKSSQWMAQDMATHTLSHIDSLGRGIGERIGSFGYPSPPNSVSENVGYTTVNGDAQTIYDGFYNECDPLPPSSECTYGHRTNMLSPQWKAIGIGRRNANGAYFWATDFGSAVDKELDVSNETTPTPIPTTSANPTPTTGSANPTPTTPPTNNVDDGGKTVSCGGSDYVTCAVGQYSCHSIYNGKVAYSCAEDLASAAADGKFACNQCVYVTPTPIPTKTAPKQQNLSCSSAGTEVTFNMKTPINVKTDSPITSITNVAGTWCAWATGNDDPLSLGRCPLSCPSANPAPGSSTAPITIAGDKLSFSSLFDSRYDDNTGSCSYKVTCEASGNNPGQGEMLQNAAVSISVTLPGISPNTGINDNPVPLHPTRNFDVSLYNDQDELVKTETASLTFNGTSYDGIATFSDIPAGSYVVKVKSDNSLIKAIPGVKKLESDKTVTTSQIALVTGNVDDGSGSKNILDLSDYNALLSCFDNKACDVKLKLLTDLNDDGKVDSRDFNILLRGFATRTGD